MVCPNCVINVIPHFIYFGKEMNQVAKQKQIQLRAISYIHDPNAAEKWFQLYAEMCVEIMKQNDSKNQVDTHTL